MSSLVKSGLVMTYQPYPVQSRHIVSSKAELWFVKSCKIMLNHAKSAQVMSNEVDSWLVKSNKLLLLTEHANKRRSFASPRSRLCFFKICQEMCGLRKFKIKHSIVFIRSPLYSYWLINMNYESMETFISKIVLIPSLSSQV